MYLITNEIYKIKYETFKYYYYLKKLIELNNLI